MNMKHREPVTLQWLKQAPQVPSGVTWGVPWAEGVLQRDEPLALHDHADASYPMQSWPTAYWPDGSVKWTAHSTVMSSNSPEKLQVKIGNDKLDSRDEVKSDAVLEVTETEEEIRVNTGNLVFAVGKHGTSIIRSIKRGDDLVCSGSQLVCILEERDELSGNRTSSEAYGQSLITRASVEQTGPVRGVIRLEGVHHHAAKGRQWLPFTVRLYLHAGLESFQMTHTFIYDGNPHQDFIKGLGIELYVPTHGPLYNRHVRMAGDHGFFGESPKNMMTWRTRGKYMDIYQEQFQGKPISFDPVEDEHFISLLKQSPVWDSFKIIQHSADHYVVKKRTKEGCSWLKAGEGRRAGGLLYAGGEQGGLALGMRNFWEKHPSSLEIQNASQDEMVMRMWFWSPDSEAMDLRHYDTGAYVHACYEGFDEMRSTPYGVANTSELRIWCLDKTPNRESLEAMTSEMRAPALLVCDPGYYHQVQAFGVWSLPDRSTESKSFLEDQLDEAVQFYQDEVERRRWYGFWDYGDVMHSYDPVRHTWRYDVGGFAWQNTELVPNMWLWYMFMRSGREDVFRLAEAMTRHTSEVDVYHLGEYAGLGSRHNVIHWGCGCKEARISMAGLHRFYYYLTADERIGDIMDEVKDSDYTTVNLDPMRAYFPKDEFPTHARVGPDWSSFTSNWLTRWERYEDVSYRDKIKVGIESLKNQPNRMMSLATHGYDPKTGELFYMGKDSGGHLAMCMGGPQVWIESVQLLKDPEWEQMLIEIGEFYNLPKEEKAKRTDGVISGSGYAHNISSAGLAAYAAMRTGNSELARLAWHIVFSSEGYGKARYSEQLELVPQLEHHQPGALYELPWISTNMVSQWSLNVIMCLALIEDNLPASLQEVRTLKSDTPS